MHQPKNPVHSVLRVEAKGSAWVLKSIEGPAVLVERLYEIGFLPGETITLLGKIPFGGPWLLFVRGATVAVRESEAQCLRF